MIYPVVQPPFRAAYGFNFYLIFVRQMLPHASANLELQKSVGFSSA
jgi:hypothetical protein